MDLKIDYRRARTLALCGELLEAAHDGTLEMYGCSPAVNEILAQLIEHIGHEQTGLLPLLRGDFKKAVEEITHVPF